MTTGRSDLIDITAELRQDRETSYAIWQGDYHDAFDTKTTSWGGPREKWIFLPKAHTEYDGKNTFTMPEWLAQEKGLI
jgi:hypothetical protein